MRRGGGHIACIPASRSRRAFTPPPSPCQVSSLSRLEHLHLIGMRSDADDYDSLLGLRSLTDQRMSECDALPASLGQLTWLRSLEVRWRRRASAPCVPPLHARHACVCGCPCGTTPCTA